MDKISAEGMGMCRINVGCGQTPVAMWRNYDNSLCVWIAKSPFLAFWIRKLRLLNKFQEEFLSFAMANKIEYANAAKHIPEADHSVEVLYSSHMLEHLDRKGVDAFLMEARRVLRHGAILRVVVPDLNKKVCEYIATGDSNKFVESLLLASDKPKTFFEKIKFLVVGPRNHRWMYDGKALCNILVSAGFDNPKVLKPGETNISNPGRLDLFERVSESVYVEAQNP